jgi:hypothetical protein
LCLRGLAGGMILGPRSESLRIVSVRGRILPDFSPGLVLLRVAGIVTFVVVVLLRGGDYDFSYW